MQAMHLLKNLAYVCKCICWHFLMVPFQCQFQLLLQTGLTKTAVAMSIALAGSGIGGSIITPILTKVIENSGWRAALFFFVLCIDIDELPVAYFLMPTSPTHLGSVKTNYDVASNSDIY